MRKIICLIISLILPAVMLAESDFTVKAFVSFKGKPAEGVKVKIYRDQLPYRLITTGKNGSFTVGLEVNNIYLIELEREGCYPLKLNVSTILPENITKKGAGGEFEIMLDLIQSFPGLDVEVLKEPIAQIKYNERLRRFDYDHEYFEFIKSQLERLYQEAEEMEVAGLSVLNNQDAIENFNPPAVNVSGKLFRDPEGKNPLRDYPVGLIDARTLEEKYQVRTDSSGTFLFENIPAAFNYEGAIKLPETADAGGSVYLANTSGTGIKKLSLDKERFRYTILPSDVIMLSSIVVDDPWIKPMEFNAQNNLIIRDIINYEKDEWMVNENAGRILDRIIMILNENPESSLEILSHTDSRGSAESNLKFSQKRAQSCVDYIVSKGIDQSRISGKGMGESNLVNYCKDLVECTENQHRENRRTEFIIRKN